MGSEGLCALDIGTTGVRAGLVGLDGDLISCEHEAYGILYGQPGAAEQEPAAIWQGLCAATQRVMAEAKERRVNVAAVAVSSQRASVLPVDADWKPQGNFLLWMDRRGREELEAFGVRVGPDLYHRTTGLPLDPMVAISKLLWLSAHQPESFAGVHRFASVQTWALRQLGCEDPPCDYSSASWYGLLDLDARRWSADLMGAAGLSRDQLGPLATSGTAVGRVSQRASEDTGLAAGTLLVLGGGDQQCSGAGGGAVTPGVVTVNLGTSGVLLTAQERPLIDESRGFITAAHVVGDLTEMEGTVPASGAVVRWLGDVFGLPSDDSRYQVLTAEAESAGIGADGLMVIPSFMGIGTPYWRDAEGAVRGLSLRHSRSHLIRATLEGISYQVRDMVQHAEQLRVPLHDFRIIGGGSRSSFWCQMLSDILGRPLLTVRNGQPAILGAALCAAVGAGLKSDVAAAARDMVRPALGYEPNPEAIRLYEDGYGRYRQLLASAYSLSLTERKGG